MGYRPNLSGLFAVLAATVLTVAVMLAGAVWLPNLLSDHYASPAADTPVVRPIAPADPVEDPAQANDPSRANTDDHADRELRRIYAEYYEHNPVYQCPDGRNAGLTYLDLARFLPCPNGALRLRITASGQLTRVAQTSVNYLFRRHPAAAPVPAAPPHGYAVARAPTGGPLSYRPGSQIRPYRVYWRVGQQPWNIVTNLSAQALQPGTDIVLTWYDPTLAPTPAWVPFDWRSVPTAPYT